MKITSHSVTDINIHPVNWFLCFFVLKTVWRIIHIFYFLLLSPALNRSVQYVHFHKQKVSVCCQCALKPRRPAVCKAALQASEPVCDEGTENKPQTEKKIKGKILGYVNDAKAGCPEDEVHAHACECNSNTSFHGVVFRRETQLQASSSSSSSPAAAAACSSITH